MGPRGTGFRLLLLGVGPRMGVALLVVALLWIGFFWATGPWGA